MTAKFQFMELIALRAMAFFECQGNGLPRRFAPRNDTCFVTKSDWFAAEYIENHRHSETSPQTGRGNPFSCNAQHCIGRRPITNSSTN